VAGALVLETVRRREGPQTYLRRSAARRTRALANAAAWSVVADACWAVDKVDLRGRRWPAEDVHALSLAHLEGEYARIVDAATTLHAAALAKARVRRSAERRR